MRTDLVTERHHRLREPVRAEILALVADAEREGTEALGEAKRAPLESGPEGARRWSGVLARASGRAVGYGHVRWGAAGSVPRATAEVVVAPDRQDREGVAKALLDEARGMVADEGGGVLYVWAHGAGDPHATLPAAAGLTVQRTLAVMERPLDDAPAVGMPPAGVALRAYRPGTDDQEVLRVNNAAFAGHPEQGGWDPTTLRARRERQWFDPEGVICAWRDDCLLGFHWTKVHPGDPPVGEVYVLAVGPGAQGMGLGRLLVSAGLAWLHQAGCRQALLYVDQANAGAVALYRAAGFETSHYEVCYEDAVAPADGS